MKSLQSRAFRLLRWSEKYTRTDMRYLAGATWWMGASSVFGGIAGLLLTFILATFLAKEDFGTYKFALSLLGIITAFSLNGVNTAITQSVARGYEGALKSGYRSAMRWSWPMVLIALGTSTYYLLAGDQVLAIALLVIAFAAPLIQNANVFNAFLLGKQDFRRVAILGCIYVGVPALITGITAYVFADALLVIIAYLLSNAVTTWSLYRYTLARFAPNDKVDAGTLTYSKHLSVMGILGSISLQADRILVFYQLGAAALAVYALALAAPQQLRVGSKILAAAALPKLSVGDEDSIRASLPRKAFVIFLVAAMLTGAYVIVAGPFFRTFFPAYEDAIPYSQLFALVILFFPASLYQQFLTARVKQRALYVLQTTVPSLKIVLLLILIPYYGIAGAILSTLAMEMFRLVIIVYLVHGRSGSRRMQRDAEV